MVFVFTFAAFWALNILSSSILLGILIIITIEVSVSFWLFECIFQKQHFLYFMSINVAMQALESGIFGVDSIQISDKILHSAVSAIINLVDSDMMNVFTDDILQHTAHFLHTLVTNLLNQQAINKVYCWYVYILLHKWPSRYQVKEKCIL